MSRRATSGGGPWTRIAPNRRIDALKFQFPTAMANNESLLSSKPPAPSALERPFFPGIFREVVTGGVERNEQDPAGRKVGYN